MVEVNSIDKQFTAAVALHNAGWLDEAATAYERLLEAAPDHPAALTNLGQLERARGETDRARSLYSRALAAPGAGPHAWYNLGNLMLDDNDRQAARRCFRAALILTPEFAEAAARIASMAREDEAFEAAQAWFTRALRIRWDQPMVHMALGALLRRLGRLVEAHDRHMVALRLAPDAWEIRYNLAQTLAALGEPRGALEHLDRAVRVAPRPVDVLASFGVYLSSMGSQAFAARHFRSALILGPDHSASLRGLARSNAAITAGDGFDWFNAAGVLASGDAAALSELATAEWDSGEEERAAATLQKVTTLLPGAPEVRHNLARALHRLWRAGPALMEARRALILAPERADAWSLLGVVLTKWARVDAALRAHGAARLIEPGNLGYVSSQAFTSLYADSPAPEGKAASHRRLAAMIEAAAPATPKPPMGKPAIIDRARLRIGYLSPDLFGQHPVAILAAPLFSGHNPSGFQIHAYSSVGRPPDPTSTRLRGHCTSWRDIAGWSDELIARAIQDDGINILVDLAGHTAGNRLALMARRPAPVQASFIGYPHSSGLRAIDALIADPIVCPPSLDPLCSETVMRLPHCVFCLDPAWSSVEIDSKGVETRRSPVYGSFNNLPKLGPATLDLWAALLRDQPTARLRLRAPSLGDAAVRASFAQHFTLRGIEPARVDLLGPCGLDDMLRDYAEIDIALDPIPYNGGTTTLQALWMGVPVVSLTGGNFCGRMGASILAAACLGDLVANTAEAYLDIARALAGNRDRLAALRRQGRNKLKSSPLCDTAGYVRHVEKLYRRLTC